MTASRVNSAPVSRRGEIVADAVIHAVAIAAAIVGAAALIIIAVTERDGVEIATVSAYSLGLLAMLGFSALYNLARQSRHRDLFQRLDHAAIFVMIAGTYTPFTTLALSGAWALGMTIFVWAAAALGIGLRLMVSAERYEKLSIALYLVFGWAGLIVAWPLLGSVGPAILILLAAGGVVYSLGTIVHAFDRLPFQNAIWHGFVVTAAAIHYAAVATLVAG